MVQGVVAGSKRGMARWPMGGLDALILFCAGVRCSAENSPVGGSRGLFHVEE